MHIHSQTRGNLDYQTVAVAAGIVLPYLARRDVRLLALSDEENEDAELARLRDTVRQWRLEGVRQSKTLAFPLIPLFLRRICVGALVCLFLLYTNHPFHTRR